MMDHLTRRCVNALHIGPLISTAKYMKPTLTKDVCVNALLVGPLISTLPLQKPFIYAGFQPRFQLHFQNMILSFLPIF